MSDGDVFSASVGDLTAAFSAALLRATNDFFTTHTDPFVKKNIQPSHFIDATRAALHSVLVAHFDQARADEVSNSWNSSSPTNASASTEKKRPVRAYIDGCFDIMHSGHYNAIRQAKALTDILVVGVHSDAEILRHKGPPVMNEEERLATVRACKWVDEVVFDTPYDPSIELLDKVNADFCVHGDDISTTADGKDAYAEVKAAGRMRIVKRTEGVSTTDLVGRLLLMTKSHHISSPNITPLTGPAITGSPALVASAIKPDLVPPSLLLEPTADAPAAATVTTASTSSNTLQTPVRKDSGASPVKKDDSHYARGISNFLPTTWRIAQFSNHRTPTKDDVVVYIDGAFDLFHVGHIETLEKAKALGTFLYVGIHDDATVNQHKGRNYPIMNLHERVMNVLSCKYVDEVVIGAPWEVTKDLITTLNIQVVASGSNTKMDKEMEEMKFEGKDPYAVAKELGIYKEIETSRSLSTDDVVHRLIDNRLKYENRNAKRSVKELNYLKGQKTYVAEI